MTAHITRVFVYPIKSCGGVELDRLYFDDKGPLFDRRWMLVDAATGLFLSQRTFPQMAGITTRLNDSRVYARYGYGKELLLPTPVLGGGKGSRRLNVTVWDDDVQGLDCGDEAAAWFSKVLTSPCRLVYQGGESRKIDPRYAFNGEEISFSDGFPLLAINQASIDFLNEQGAAQVIGVERFRPNIVLQGDASPAFDEEAWQQLIHLDSGVVLAAVKPCQRCVIPSLDPLTGSRQPDVMAVLLAHCRRQRSGDEAAKVYFGQNLMFDRLPKSGVGVGDSVEIQYQGRPSGTDLN